MENHLPFTFVWGVPIDAFIEILNKIQRSRVWIFGTASLFGNIKNRLFLLLFLDTLLERLL